MASPPRGAFTATVLAATSDAAALLTLLSDGACSFSAVFAEKGWVANTSGLFVAHPVAVAPVRARGFPAVNADVILRAFALPGRFVTLSIFPVAIVRARFHATVRTKVARLTAARSFDTRAVLWGSAIVHAFRGFVRGAAVHPITATQARFFLRIQAVETFPSVRAVTLQRLGVAFAILSAETFTAWAALVFEFAAFAAKPNLANANAFSALPAT